MQIQRGTGAVASLPAGEPVQRPSTPALSPWPAAQGSSPQTPATPFPAAHNLMRDVPLLQDIAADRAHAHAQDHAFPPLQQVHRKALLIGAALLVVGLIVAIATSGGSNKTAAKAEGDDAPPPVTNPDPPREAPVKQPVAAPPTQVPDAAPQKVDEPPPSPAPPEDVSPGEVVMDPEPTATPGSGSAPRRRPAVVPKQAPKRQ
jgi:hypothetical protein